MDHFEGRLARLEAHLRLESVGKTRLDSVVKRMAPLGPLVAVLEQFKDFQQDTQCFTPSEEANLHREIVIHSIGRLSSQLTLLEEIQRLEAVLEAFYDVSDNLNADYVAILARYEGLICKFHRTALRLVRILQRSIQLRL